MKTIILILAICFQLSAQSKFFTLYDSGISYEIETLAYKTRVEADGGTVINIGYLDDFIKDAKNKGYYDSLLVAVDVNWGVKKNANNKVLKLYDLFNRMYDYSTPYYTDYAQSDTSQSPSFVPNKLGSMGGIKFDGNNDIMIITTATGSNNVPQPLTTFNTVELIASIDGKRYIDNGSNPIIFSSSSGKVWMFNGGVLLDGTAISTGTPYLFANIFNATNSKFYRNNTLNNSGDAGSGGWGGHAGFSFYLGGALGQFANIYFFNFIVKRGVGNVSNINTFLNSKYEIY